MHVAHFIQRYPPALGGSEAYFARLADYHLACGDEVSVWTTTALDLESFWRSDRQEASPGRILSRPLDLRRYSLCRFPGRRYILKSFSLVPVRRWQCLTMPCNPHSPGMWRDVGRYTGPLDAVHATAFPYAFPILCALRLARQRGVPFLLTPFLHLGNPDNPSDQTRKQYTAPPLRWLLRQADRVFVQTRLEWDAVVGLGVPTRRVVLQGLGVDSTDCTGGDRRIARKGWSVGPEEVVVGHLANQSAEKGSIDLLKAAKRVWAEGHRFRLVLAGPEMTNFRTFWDGFTPKERVTRLGVLTDAQKRDFYAGIDAFALPSRSDSFGLVLLEAWANGRPNLVYRAGGPAELVRDEVDGLQAHCGDVQELARNLRRLVTDGTLRHRLGQAGQERVERDFRWGEKLELVREVIREVREGVEHSAGQEHKSVSRVSAGSFLPLCERRAATEGGPYIDCHPP